MFKSVLTARIDASKIAKSTVEKWLKSRGAYSVSITSAGGSAKFRSKQEVISIYSDFKDFLESNDVNFNNAYLSFGVSTIDLNK